MTQHLERIPLSEVHDLLHVGHSLPFRVLDAQARLLLKEGHVLLNEAQFESLVERGAWAERSQVEAERVARAAGRTPPAAPPPSLFDRWDRLLWDFDKLSRASLRGAALGHAVTAFFAQLQALVERDADVALFLALRHDDQRFALYPLTHAMHCALVAVLTARQLGWPAPRIASVGCAALTMNWSMFDLQATMAEQDTPPTARQLKLIRAHPEAAVELLRAGGVDVMLVDLSMPDQSGVEVLAAIKARAPELPVLILSGFPEQHYATTMLKQGAAGYLNKDCDPEEIAKAMPFEARKYIPIPLSEVQLDWAIVNAKKNQSAAPGTMVDVFLVVVLMTRQTYNSCAS